MADITSLVNYYTNLLITQYWDKPKAQQTIALYVSQILASGIALDIQNAYNINTAVGVQLDVLGKYVGVDRYYPAIDLVNYSGAVTYSEVGSLPSSPPVFGLETYATFNSDYDYNGTLVYSDILTTNNALFDNDFRTLIKLKIIINNSNFSDGEIDTAMFNTFGTSIRPEDAGNMHMVYFLSIGVTPLVAAIIYKGLLPKPMGVGLRVVDGVGGLMFGCVSYTQQVGSPFEYGLSTYANYASLSGQDLVYNQIS